MKTFEFPQKVLFKHCDPAGIVFYPRYFEMMNDCIEAFFDEALGMPFETLHATGGVPTGRIETRFSAPSRHGDHLTFRLKFVRIGGSSADYVMTAHCEDELRLTTKATLVHVGAIGRSAPWPEAIRERLNSYKDEAQ